jgi:cobyrinic acid a,c-diamide synthase
MYLTEEMTLLPGWQGREDEKSARMCGVFRGKTSIPAKRVVSYVEGTSAASSPLGPGPFRGHEFHYSSVTLDRDTQFAYRLTRGIGIRDNLDGAQISNTLGSYTHLHPVASAGMFRHFVDLCRKTA